MRCEVCMGSGTINAKYDEPMPCANCGGLGQVHCCEGVREQPEQDDRSELSGEDAD